MKTNKSNFVPSAAPDDLRAEQRAGNLSTSSQMHSRTTSTESFIRPADDADGMFTHAPVSLWEEDFSEVKRRFDQLKRMDVDDLRKYLNILRDVDTRRAFIPSSHRMKM